MTTEPLIAAAGSASAAFDEGILASARASRPERLGFRSQIEDYERRLILAALAECGGCQARAAAQLGLRATTLHEKIKRYRLREEFLPRVTAADRAVTPLSEEFVWRGALGPGATLGLKSVSGSVRARRASGPEAELVAVKRATGDDCVALSVVESPRGVAFSVLRASPDSDPGHSARLQDGVAGLRVDFRIAVPVGVGLSVRLLFGDVEVIGLEAPVEASSLNGRVAIVGGVTRA